MISPNPKCLSFRFSQLLLLAAASACCASRPLANTADSTRVEVRTERVVEHDTTFVEIPLVVERVATLDTVSRIENDFARSEAAVSGGTLRHSLETKPARLPVAVEKEIVYRDSLVYRDRIIRETVEVERRLSFWQKFKMRAGVAAMVLAGLWGLYLLAKRYLKRNN